MTELVHIKRYDPYYQQMDMRMASAVGLIDTIKRVVLTVANPPPAASAATATGAAVSVPVAGTSDRKTDSKSESDSKNNKSDEPDLPHNTLLDLLNTPLLNPNDFEPTPLHAAAVRGQADAVQLLLSLGANPHIENCDGENAAEALLFTPTDEQTWLYPATAMYNTARNYDDSESSNPMRVALDLPEHDPSNRELVETIGHSFITHAKEYAKTHPLPKPDLKPTSDSMNESKKKKTAKHGAGPTATTTTTATTKTLKTAASEMGAKPNASGSSAVAGPDDIPCPVCTFLNDRKSKTCEVCGEALPVVGRQRAMMDWPESCVPRFLSTLECLVAFGARAIDLKTFNPDTVTNGYGSALVSAIGRGEKRFHERRNDYRRAVLGGIANFDGDVSSVVVDYLLSTPPVGTFRRIRLTATAPKRRASIDSNDGGGDMTGIID